MSQSVVKCYEQPTNQSIKLQKSLLLDIWPIIASGGMQLQPRALTQRYKYNPLPPRRGVDR